MKKFIIFNIILLVGLSDLYSNTFNYDSDDGKDIMSAVGEKGKKQLKCKKTGCLSNANQKICGGRIIFNDYSNSKMDGTFCDNDYRCYGPYMKKCNVQIYTYVDTDLPLALTGKLSKKYKKIEVIEVTDENGNKIDKCSVRECSSSSFSSSCKDVNYSNVENTLEEIEIFRYEDQSLVYNYDPRSEIYKVYLTTGNNCSGYYTDYSSFPYKRRYITAEVIDSPCSKEGCIEWETDALDILSIMPDIGLEAINTDLIEY